MAIVFTWTVLLLGLGLLVLGVRALVKWRGRWRWLALAPMLLVVGVALRIVLEVRADPTSNNLWPIEALAAVVAAGVLLGVLELIRIGVRWWSRPGNA